MLRKVLNLGQVVISRALIFQLYYEGHQILHITSDEEAF